MSVSSSKLTEFIRRKIGELNKLKLKRRDMKIDECVHIHADTCGVTIRQGVNRVDMLLTNYV